MDITWRVSLQLPSTFSGFDWDSGLLTCSFLPESSGAALEELNVVCFFFLCMVKVSSWGVYL